MGRPINKRYMGNQPGAIQVTAYRRAAGLEVSATPSTYIVSQRGSNKFLIADSVGAWQEVLTLTAAKQGSLLPGEFMVLGMDQNGNADSITKIYDRKLRWGGSNIPWATTQVPVRSGPITIMTVSAPAYISSPAHGLVTGDVVYVAGIINGPTLINGRSYTVITTKATSFGLVGSSSLGQPVWSLGGSWRQIVTIPGKIAIDTRQ